MKVFLFLYPVPQYFEACFNLQGRTARLLPQQQIRLLSRLIDQRYRQQDYRVAWTLFRPAEVREAPDAVYTLLRPEDARVTASVSFKELCRYIYPDLNDMLAQLPRPLTRLVLGGFHLHDCVDKLAAHAYTAGIPTVIDEDATEKFFFCMQEPSRLADICDSPGPSAILGHFNNYLPLHEYQTSQRRGKPWLLPLPSPNP